LAGYYDCDGNEANGCETTSGLDDCAGCGDDCTNQTLYPNTTGQSCPAGVCEYQCTLGYDDCEAGQPGCETPLGTVQNCSGCDDACAGSADGGKLCIDDAGVWRCGCANETDCDSPDMCCDAFCTPHDEQHCEDCNTGCTVVTGGPVCVDTGGGVWACQCNQDSDCKGTYQFSGAYCDSGGTNECLCTGSEMCAETVQDMCCFSGGVNSCVDLRTDADHCGICRIACEAGETCTDGACSCSGTICPDNSGAPDCQLGSVCGCNYYGGDPCPPGQYCCDQTGADQPNGCCMSDCSTTISGGNSCSSDCGAPKTWCQSGCCDSCDPDTNCD
jgi:hypothetical protein